MNMANFWKVVNKVIDDSDILLLILDAKLSNETRNEEIENKVINKNKPFIYVINKCDLISQEESEKIKKRFRPSVFVSSTEYHGLKMLRETIIIMGKREYPDKDRYVAGILGYPNVGKSSLINAMTGRAAAGVSNASGFTKGVQKIKVDNKLLFLDTPGVIPYKENDAEKHAIISTVDYNKAKDLDLIVMQLMEKFKGKIEEHFNVEVNLDFEEKIEEIAKSKNLLRKGGVPDIERTCRLILKEWQEGKIRI